MTLQIGQTAPNFTQDSTEGPLNLYDYAGDSWVILFSHPKDFTPVCTTELGDMAKLQPEFAKRNTKILGLSVDPADDHKRWVQDIAYTTAGYRDVLLTYSGHLELPEASRRGLLDCIAELIDARFGGRITKRYLFELRLAQRLS